MRLLTHKLTSLAVLVGAVALGCGSGDNPGEPTLDYHQDAKTVIDRYCTSCHQAGGIAPFALTNYAEVQSHLINIQNAVGSDSMPPWLPADDGVPLRYSRKMRPDDKKLLLDWIAGGALEGDPAAASRVVIPLVELPAPPRDDLVLTMGESYLPNAKLADDYRCFVLEPEAGGGGLPGERYLQAANITPGAPAVVHHVIIFEVPASAAADARAKDAAEPGPGYTCFGGPGVGTHVTDGVQMVMGWAPGMTPTRLQADEAVVLRKGSIFVMQVHYNLSNFSGQSDVTAAHLELAASPPANQVLLLPIANPGGLKIPAGAADASQTIFVPVSEIVKFLGLPDPSLTINSVIPHMHLLGTQIITSVGNQPLVDIQKWDFHWQQSYQLQEPLVAASNQSIIVECHYDNTAAHQPIVDGAQKVPVDVKWGEGTYEEMCLSFVGIRFPRPTGP